MSGQDHAMIASPDTLDTITDALVPALFEISGLSEEAMISEGAIPVFRNIGTSPPDWLFIYLLALFGYIAWIRYFYGNIFTQTIQASTNFQVATRMFKDNSVLQKQLDNILYSFYFLSIAFLMVIVERKLQLYPYGFQEAGLVLFNLAILLGVFFVRIVVVNLTGFLFNRVRIFREYLYNSFIFNKLIGFIILPLLLFMVYTTGFIQEVFHWLAFATITIIIVIRVIRGIIFSLKKEVLIFYMFLYLCALEIIPLALLYRWLQGIL